MKIKVCFIDDTIFATTNKSLASIFTTTYRIFIQQISEHNAIASNILTTYAIKTLRPENKTLLAIRVISEKRKRKQNLPCLQ